jgi:hypothetical protein
MSGYVVNIEDVTAANVDYRRVLFTAKHTQLVLMNLKPGEEIGEEVHELDQFIRIEAGRRFCHPRWQDTFRLRWVCGRHPGRYET